MRMTDAAGLVGLLLLCTLVAGVGGVVTAGAVRTWYPRLRKPGWNPPSSLFGPVWSLLYLMMAVAAWLVWRARDLADVTIALGLFGLQLALNLLWSVLFFGLRRPAWALGEIVLLWLSIVATTAAFWNRDPIAGALLLPYLLWVTFAAVLNGAILRLNPSSS
jgi:tryptophan-rich sensory protein